MRFRHTPRAGDAIRDDQQGRKDSNPVPRVLEARCSPRSTSLSEVEGIRRELNPAPRDSHSRVLPLHHEHHHVRAGRSREVARSIAGRRPPGPRPRYTMIDAAGTPTGSHRMRPSIGKRERAAAPDVVVPARRPIM